MRCSTFSIANGLNLKEIQSMFRHQGIGFQSFGDAIYRNCNNKCIYYFANGTIVTWNFYRHNTEIYLYEIRKFCQQPYKKPEEDHFSYSITGKTDIKPHEYFNIDLITLEEDENEERLSIAYALSQSIKLKSYEEQIENLIKKHTHLVKSLSSAGSIKLSRNKILKAMGTLFLAKEQINLESEYHNPPKFFWQRSSYEADYLLIKNYLDIPRRVAGLNQKLDTLNEMIMVLNGQLQHQHSSVLEIIIILLLVVEIGFSLLHFWF